MSADYWSMPAREFEVLVMGLFADPETRLSRLMFSKEGGGDGG